MVVAALGAVLRVETDDRAADLGTLTDRVAVRAADFLFGAVRLSVDWAGRRTAVRGLANAPFFFFIDFPFFPDNLCALHQRSQRPPADQVQVQVVDLLTTVGVAIDDQPIAALGNVLLAGDIPSDDDHVSNQGLIFICDIIGGWNDLDRYN
jgi:hypothetical protein